MYASNIARTRYTGLSSGIDIDSLVKASLQTYYTKIDTNTKQKTLTEWKKDAYRDMNTSLSTFRDKYFSYSSSSTTSLRSLSSMQTKKATTTDNSYVKVTANSNADIENHTITDVQTAEKAIAASGKIRNVSSSDVSGMTLDQLAELKDENGNNVLTLGEKNADGKYSITIGNGDASKTIELDGSMTASAAMSSINSAAKEAGIDASLSFNEITRQFEFKSSTTGADQKVSISMLENGATKSGKNASVTIDGEKHESANNSFTVGGLKFEALTSNNTGSDLNIGVNVKQDTDATFDKIMSFVNDYNALISDINSKISERTTSYLPLTSEEKEAMQDSDIEEWTKKAKQGMFYNDRTLRNLVSKMRSVFSDSDVAGTGKSLSSIGIKTGSYETKGQLVVDEAKLREALENDPDTVAKMFAGTGGLSETFSKNLDAAVDTIRDVTISGFTSKISSYDKAIDKLYDTLEKREDALYDVYAKMETTIANLQSQMSSLGF